MNFDFLRGLSRKVVLPVALEEIERAQLVLRSYEDELAYMFKHALVQDTTYATMLKEERRRLHSLVAKTLEQENPNHLDEMAARLAQHYAEAGADEETFLYALRAANVAVHHYGYAEARTYYAQALGALARLPDDTENRRRYVDTIIRQMRVTRLALDPLENLRVLLRAEEVMLSLHDGSEPTVADRKRLARLHYWIGTIRVMRTDLTEATEYLEKARRAALELNDPRLEKSALSVLLGVMTMRGQFGKAVPLLTTELERNRSEGDWFEWVYLLAMLAYAHAGQGHLALAQQEADLAVARARELNNPARLVEVMGTIVGIYSHGGDLAKFLEVSQQTLADAEKSGERVYLFLYVQRAFAKSRLGNAPAALAELRRAKEMNLGETEHRFFADWLVAGEADIALTAGQLPEAIALAEKAVAIAHRAGGLYGGGFAERVWGLALMHLDPPRDEQAEAHLAASLRLFEEGEIRIESARTRVAWAEMLIQRGSHARAREHLEKAANQFQESELVSELEQAQRLLQSLSN